MARGVAFDKQAADKLAQVLMEAQAVNDLEVKGLCADFEDEYRTPKKQVLKVRKTVFNPSSRDHIARWYGGRLDQSLASGLDAASTVLGQCLPWCGECDRRQIEGIRKRIKQGITVRID